MTQRFRKLSHSLYECKYHIVFCPKYRYRIFKETIGDTVRQLVYQLCKQKEQIEVLELNASGGINTAKVFSIGIHGLSERKNGIAIVPTI